MQAREFTRTGGKIGESGTREECRPACVCLVKATDDQNKRASYDQDEGERVPPCHIKS